MKSRLLPQGCSLSQLFTHPGTEAQVCQIQASCKTLNGINGEPKSGLERRLGLTVATLTGVGVILGAGIYVLVGVAAGEAGNAVWLSFLFAAVVAGLSGLSYALPQTHYIVE